MASMASVASAVDRRAYVAKDPASGIFSLSPESSDTALVNASYTSDVAGWGYLTIAASSSPETMSSDDILATYRAAGYAEGNLVCAELELQASNTFDTNGHHYVFTPSHSPPAVP